MVRLIVEMAEQYHDCAARHKAYVCASDPDDEMCQETTDG